MPARWTKGKALKELQALAEETNGLGQVRRHSEQHTCWTLRTMELLKVVLGPRSSYYLSFCALPWAHTGTFVFGGPLDVEGIFNPAAAIKREDQRAYVEQLETARGILLAAVDCLRESDIDSVYEGKDTGPESSEIVKVINLAQYKLRKVIRKLPQKEKEIQDRFEDLLNGAGILYSRETEHIEYSSKTYIPDFTMPRLDLALELKLRNHKDREKKMIAEINDDIQAYGTKYGNLFFVVYDLGFIRDTDRFASSLQQTDSVIVRVIKH